MSKREEVLKDMVDGAVYKDGIVSFKMSQLGQLLCKQSESSSWKFADIITIAIRWESMTKVEPDPKTEWLYECVSNHGGVAWFFEDGAWAHFDEKRKCFGYQINCLARKTGRKVKIDMDTFEFVGKVVSDKEIEISEESYQALKEGLK